MADSYKVRKEAFVSNLEGTSMLEIAALSAIVPGFMVLGQIVVSCSARKGGEEGAGRRRRLWRDLCRSVAMEVTLVILPILSCFTILAESAGAVLASLICVLLATHFALRSRIDDEQQQVHPSRKSFLTAYRCAMMLVTCITILAVDFTIYPRRLAKTETYGTGLMDVGVGSFVVANALVSRQARGLPPSKHGGALRDTSPLLILGFARLILTKGVDYQEHVGEYGVHWNFFFTLAAVTLLTSLIHIPASASGSLGVIILVAYQAWLSSGLNEYLLSSERGCSLVDLNKEGIYSTLGYWSLYLISVQLGYIVNHSPGHLFRRFSKLADGETLKEESGRWYIALEVWGLDGLFWVLAAVVNEFVERVSRRTCNLAYVLFVLGQNFQVIGSFALAEAFLPLRKMLWMDAFDHNLLPTFLLANCLTGLVNISTDTISATPLWAFSTLVAYLAFLAGGMTLADAFHLRLKFW